MSSAAPQPLNYVVEGEGPGEASEGRPEDRPAVVLIHGVGANLQSWDALVPRFAERFRVIRMDLAGHGESPPIRDSYSLERFADDIVAVLDREGVARCHVVGFSLGGLIAQTLALDWPDRVDRLALLSAVAGRTQEEREKVVSRLAMIRDGGIVAVTGAARDRWFTAAFAEAHPERIAARIAELIANDKESYMEAYRVFGLGDNADRLHEIGHRTLVLTGEHDSGSNTRMARLMHERIRDSRLVILPELKHSILVEAPDLVADHVLGFLIEP